MPLEKQELRILEQRESWIAVQKPAGVSSESDGMGELIARALGRPAAQVFPVHRLDRDVAGVMVYALNRKAAAFLSRASAEHRMQKTYLALAEGIPPEKAGRWEDLLYHDPRRNKTFVVKRPRRGVKTAALEYRVLRCIPAEEPGNDTGRTLSLLEIRLETGRSHQIRVQCASRGMPLAGDRKYGGSPWRETGLYAWRLQFPDPDTGEERSYTMETPVPFLNVP